MDDSTRALVHLQVIRSKYLEVKKLTDGLSETSEDSSFESAARERSLLLAQIQQEQYELNTQCSGWKENFRNDSVLKRAADEVETLILRIVARDQKIQQIIKSRMAAVKEQINNLARNSKAALAYSAHATA